MRVDGLGKSGESLVFSRQQHDSRQERFEGKHSPLLRELLAGYELGRFERDAHA